MAERTLQKVEEQLNCSVCLDTYANPKLLQCSHVYCKECLVHLVVRDQRGKLSLTCPTCRHTTPIPDAGVSALQSAFHINHLLEIVREHKKNLSCCADHVDEELKLFCETCNKVICYKCAFPGGQHHNHVSSVSMVDPLKCHATGKALETATVGEKSIVTVQAVSWSGCPCVEPIKSLECELECVQSEVGMRGGVEEKGRGEYEITYQPVTEGRSQLHIRIEGTNIQGSPFNVKVVSPVEWFRAPIQTLKGIKNPWGVAFNRVGEMVVTTADCVSVLDLNGAKLRSFGTRGSGHGQLLAPRGVTVDDHGNILVADSGNHRIQKFAGRGKFLASVGTKGTGSLQFNSPRDLAFNACTKKIYVVDSENNRIQVLNSDLTISSLIGGKQCCRSVEFCYPWGITCDSSGNVYVADSAEHHIQVFAASGEFLRKFGGCGS